jgi:hypothetical protein
MINTKTFGIWKDGTVGGEFFWFWHSQGRNYPCPQALAGAKPDPWTFEKPHRCPVRTFTLPHDFQPLLLESCAPRDCNLFTANESKEVMPHAGTPALLSPTGLGDSAAPSVIPNAPIVPHPQIQTWGGLDAFWQRWHRPYRIIVGVRSLEILVRPYCCLHFSQCFSSG